MVAGIPPGVTEEDTLEVMADLESRMPAAHKKYDTKSRGDLSVVYARQSGECHLSAFKRNVMARPRAFAGQLAREPLFRLKQELEKLNLTFEDLGTSEKELRAFIQNNQPS